MKEIPASNAKKAVKKVKGKNAAKATQAKGKGAVTAMKRMKGNSAMKAIKAKGKRIAKTDTWICVKKMKGKTANTHYNAKGKSGWEVHPMKIEHVEKIGWEVNP